MNTMKCKLVLSHIPESVGAWMMEGKPGDSFPRELGRLCHKL